MGRQPMAGRLDLTEMKRGLPIPSRQHGLEDIILRFKKNLFQLLLDLLRNAFHGKVLHVTKCLPILRRPAMLTEIHGIVLLTFFPSQEATRKLLCTPGDRVSVKFVGRD
jgi:hypothetical protein